MVTKTFKRNLTVQVRVEANNKLEADIEIGKIEDQLQEELPTGAKLIVRGITRRA